MLALAEYRQGCCGGCGGNLAVTTAAENEGKFRPLLPVQCYRCVAFSRSYQTYSKDADSRTLIHLVPHEPNR